MEKISETLERTAEVTRSEIARAEISLSAVEPILVDVLSFLETTRQRVSSAPEGERVTIAQASLESLREWANNELTRVRIRPEVLRERERTLESVNNYVKSISDVLSGEERGL